MDEFISGMNTGEIVIHQVYNAIVAILCCEKTECYVRGEQSID